MKIFDDYKRAYFGGTGEMSLRGLDSMEGAAERNKGRCFKHAIQRKRELSPLKIFKKIVAWNHLGQCLVQYLEYTGLAIELPD